MKTSENLKNSEQTKINDLGLSEVRPSIIKELKMEIRNDIAHVRLNIKGLCGKNYKCEFKDDKLIVTAVCWQPKWRNGAKQPHFSLATVVYSFHVPCAALGDGLWSEYQNGMIDVFIPVVNEYDRIVMLKQTKTHSSYRSSEEDFHGVN